MKINLILMAALLGAAGSAHGALFSELGLERSGNDFVYTPSTGRMILTVEQGREMAEFEAALEKAPDPEAALGLIVRRELDAEGRAPDSLSTDGAAWFLKTASGWTLTDAGRRAVPGIILKASAGSSAAPDAPAKPKLDLAAAQIDAALEAEASPNFDGVVPAKSTLPDAPKPQAKPSAVEKDLFWSTWYGYHAAFVADFTTTGMVLGRGGYETDHLYTQFGNKNMAGVIGSAVVLHAGASLASYELYKQAQKRHGFWRYALDAAAIGINAYGVGVHTAGAGHNVGVLQNWNSR